MRTKAFSPLTILLPLLSFNLGCFGDSILRARGIVVNPQGDPVVGATVQLQNDGRVDEVQTDNEGCFSIARTSAPGWYRFKLVASAPDHDPATKKLRNLTDHRVVVELAPIDDEGRSSIEIVDPTVDDRVLHCGRR